MRCTSPRTVGFQEDGKTLCWSSQKYSKQYPTFQLPCGKCLSCRLERARETAVRCVHEASMNEKNSFITLTYSDEKLKSPKLIYKDFQDFVKRLRTHIHDSHKQILSKEELEKIRISIFVTGEYGEKNKRPHWHAIIFNWFPSDAVPYRTSDRGDKLYTSETLDKLWGHNDPTQRPNEIGAVTFESAGYCARYASKKLTHGRDGTHEYEPISKRSCKNAIGKKWLEKYWKQTFDLGYVTIQKSSGEIVKMPIPRYYEKWLKKNHPEYWRKYATTTKEKQQQLAKEKEEKISNEEKIINLKRAQLKGLQTKRTKVREKILKQKFDGLQQKLKL